MIHIFLDESGGCAPSEQCFLVVGLLIAPSAAMRIVKTFRKAAKLKEEIHGHELTIEQRRIFFDLFNRHNGSAAAVVVCQRSTNIGGWSMNVLREHDLRAEMILEACELLATTGLFQVNTANVPRVGVTQDGGRYTRAVLADARRQITESLEARIAGTRFTVQYGDSAQTAGLQLADVIGNTVFRRFTGGEIGAAEHLLDAAERAGRLYVQTAALRGRRPDWL